MDVNWKLPLFFVCFAKSLFSPWTIGGFSAAVTGSPQSSHLDMLGEDHLVVTNPTTEGFDTGQGTCGSFGLFLFLMSSPLAFPPSVFIVVPQETPPLPPASCCDKCSWSQRSHLLSRTIDLASWVSSSLPQAMLSHAPLRMSRFENSEQKENL